MKKINVLLIIAFSLQAYPISFVLNSLMKSHFTESGMLLDCFVFSTACIECLHSTIVHWNQLHTQYNFFCCAPFFCCAKSFWLYTNIYHIIVHYCSSFLSLTNHYKQLNNCRLFFATLRQTFESCWVVLLKQPRAYTLKTHD